MAVAARVVHVLQWLRYGLDNWAIVGCVVIFLFSSAQSKSQAHAASHSLGKGKGKAIPLQALTGPEGSRRLRLSDFKTFGTWRW
jgi:hypothetical protein